MSRNCRAATASRRMRRLTSVRFHRPSRCVHRECDTRSSAGPVSGNCKGEGSANASRKSRPAIVTARVRYISLLLPSCRPRRFLSERSLKPLIWCGLGEAAKRCPQCALEYDPDLARDQRFADSPLEGNGFEPSVPRQIGHGLSVRLRPGQTAATRRETDCGRPLLPID